MVHFVQKRLQVFVSSTYHDLLEERQAAVEAILVAGHIPAGMELFTAGDEGQMDVIKQWIDESDVYLLILGGRYGSIEPTTKKSYTRLEYEYALKLEKPMFACVVSEEALERKVKAEGSTVLENIDPAGLKDFRALVLSKVSTFWDDPKDIKIAIGATLSQLSRCEDLIGWVRPSDSGADINNLADEIARLSKENAQYRERAALHQEANILGFTFSEMIDLLSGKELLDFLLDQRDVLSSIEGLSINRPYGESGGPVGELKFIGIIAQDLFDGKYRLTTEGKMFLSRLDLQKLKIDSASPS